MKWRALAEVCIVFAVFQIVRLFLPGVNSLVRWEQRVLGWSYFTGFLMVLLPTLILISRKREFESCGLTLHGWGASLDVGLKGFLYLIGPQLLLAWLTFTGVDYRHLEGSLFLSGAVFVALVLLLRRLNGEGYAEFSTEKVRLLIVSLLLLFPLAVGAILGRLTLRVVSTTVWQFVFGGFAEELLYRGYIQSTVNDEYGRPWSFLGTQFGPGLLASSAMYGLHRALSTVKPWIGVYEVSLSWALYAFTVGVFHGFLRERSGDIIAPSVAGGLMDSVGETFLKVLR